MTRTTLARPAFPLFLPPHCQRLRLTLRAPPQDILKYTYNANKLWSVGTRDYALPDTVSVYHPLTTCSLETQSSTSSIASSADKAASESQSRGGGYEKVVEQTTKAEKGGVETERKQTKTTQVGFGRSKETKSYE